MKKFLLISILVNFLVLPLIGLSNGDVTDIVPAPNLPFLPTLNKIINIVFTILIIFTVLMIMVAAYYFVTAAGDPEKTKTARNFVLWALIGLIVAFLAKGIIWFLCNQLAPGTC